MHLEAFDTLREQLAKTGLTPRIETRLALFLSTTKSLNLPFLSLAEAGSAQDPDQSSAWQALNSQFFRECEALTVLMRVTRWAPEPMLYWRNSAITAPLVAAALPSGLVPLGYGPANLAALEALALGHALLAATRLTPILPLDLAADPFAVAMARIEQENGRMLQTQIRLLKDGFAEVPIETREEIIGRKSAVVDKVFAAFLKDLIG